MDDLERDLSELLQQRVAALPDQYEAPPALVGRARRRRTLKRVSLVVSVVVIATGTAAGVAQVAGRQHPHHVITTLPPPSTTSTTATLPASTSTSTSPPRPRVATVACPITYILTGETPYPAPVIEPRVPQAGDRTLLGHLTSFAATTDPRYVVLAPTGWTCAMTAATDGQNGMDVQPPGAAPGSDPGSTGGVAIINDYLWHGGVGSTLACTVFDDPALVQYVTQNYPGQLPCPSAGRTVTRVDTHIATFVDPDGTHGVGWMALPSSQQADDGKYSILRCKPTVGLTTADCDTIIADFIARNDVPGGTVGTPTTAIAAPPFRPGDWATTTNGVVITDSGGRRLAAYDAGTATWRTEPAPPINGQPWIFATRGNDVYVNTEPANDSATATPFAVLDVGTGTWRTLAPVPDRVFGKLESAGDADHLFGFGAFDADYVNPKFAQHEVAVEYDVASNHWSALPEWPLTERSGEALQWTGHELLVWSGGDYHQGGGGGYDDGAAYAPATRKWRMLPVAPVEARVGAASVWTGTEMLVWGGSDCIGCSSGAVGAGAAYDPATDRWRKLTASPLRATESPAAVWTGTEMIVLGGSAPGVPAAAAYEPSADTWTSLPAPPAAARTVLGAAAESWGSWDGGIAIFGVLGASQKVVDFSAFSYVLGG